MAVSGIPLSATVRQSMFELWMETRSESKVGRKFGVCLKTVQKYCTLDDWQKRAEERRRKLAKAADYDYVKEKNLNLALIRAAKAYVLEKIQERVVKVRVSDLDSLIRVQQLIVGEPDSHPKLEIENELSQLTAIELRELIASLRNRTGKT